MSLRNVGAPRRGFGDPVAREPKQVKFVTPPSSDVNDLNLPLHAIAADANDRIESSGRMVFHCVGDTGGINGTDIQEAVAYAMETQLKPAQAKDAPAFFYHLGDVVYYNGMPTHYEEQFYEPYQHYVAPIVAIAGNHDGQVSVQKGDEPDPFPTLEGFMRNFCATHSEFASHDRDTMTQPYAWWTLDTPVATIIGLYSNVDGSLDGRGNFEQQNFLIQQLNNASEKKALLIAVHHPPYSLDTKHGGSPDVGTALDHAFNVTKRTPDLILSGHVHSYQRFSRKMGNRKIPYVVAGSGGYANTQNAIHKVQHPKNGPMTVPFKTTVDGVTLEKFQDELAGFSRITIDKQPQQITLEYFTIPFNVSEPTPQLFESETFKW
jgi:hypothetical protein